VQSLHLLVRVFRLVELRSKVHGVGELSTRPKLLFEVSEGVLRSHNFPELVWLDALFGLVPVDPFRRWRFSTYELLVVFLVVLAVVRWGWFELK
jgi:hypothetical protein